MNNVGGTYNMGAGFDIYKHNFSVFCSICALVAIRVRSSIRSGSEFQIAAMMDGPVGLVSIWSSGRTADNTITLFLRILFGLDSAGVVRVKLLLVLIFLNINLRYLKKKKRKKMLHPPLP